MDNKATKHMGHFGWPGAIRIAGAESPVPGPGHLLPAAPVEGGS